MPEGFKDRTPDEQRALADSALADGFSRLAHAIQQVGMVALISEASDRELRIINQRNSPLADEEFQQIIQPFLIQVGKEITEQYVNTARRAMRFDELEGSNG